VARRRKVAQRVERNPRPEARRDELTENDLSSLPMAVSSRTPRGATTALPPPSTLRSARGASERCGATLPRRTWLSVGPTSSAPTPTSPPGLWWP